MGGSGLGVVRLLIYVYYLSLRDVVQICAVVRTPKWMLRGVWFVISAKVEGGDPPD